jgi:8-oxo-dGTP pyrophosphatase MutT (NUDIX family)
MAGFSIRTRRRVLTGPVITVDDLVMVAPDGSDHHRQIVCHPGAVSVVPLQDDGTVVLVRQYRAALGTELLELPAGKRDVSGELPEVTAARELAEEVGLQAATIEQLAEFHNSPGFCDEHSIVYLARGLTPTATERQGIEELHLEVVEVPIADVPALIATGELKDAKTIIGLLLALRHPSVAGDAA